LLDDLGPGDRAAVAFIPGGRVIDFTRHPDAGAARPAPDVGRCRDAGERERAAARGDRRGAGLSARRYERLADGRRAGVQPALSERIERQICANELTNEMEQLSYGGLGPPGCIEPRTP